MSNSAFVMSKTRWYRLRSQYLLCLLCFVVGCTLTISFISSSGCTNVNDVDCISTEKSNGSNKKEKLTKTLVILIPTSPDNIFRRHALRRTWLTLVDQELIKYYFVVGSKGISDDMDRKLLTEGEHYSDLLVLPEVEEGYNLLTKKLLSSFLWVEKNVEFKFLLKVDDDSFVDIRLLLRELLRKSDIKRLYWGYFNGRAQVQRQGKWKELNWNLCDRYLPYARGGGYVLSRQLVQYLAQNAKLLNIYKNEDVSVGAWLAPLNVTRVHDVRLDTEWSSRGCSNEYLITHPHDISEMNKLHESLTKDGHICQVESVKRPSYIYDWTVLPSKCCSSASP